LEARATPKHKGSATKNTTIEEGKSAPRFFKEKPVRFIVQKFKVKQWITCRSKNFSSKQIAAGIKR
jgi:hypothetical protein